MVVTVPAVPAPDLPGRASASPYRSASVELDHDGALHLDTDVLVLGGGPAGLWAALAGREHGARVVVADKGYVGTSGVAAPSGTNHWLVPPDASLRDEEIGVKEADGRELTDRRWIERMLDTAGERVACLPGWGYDEPSLLDTPIRRFYGQSPGYLRFLRGRARKVGVTLLDHSPALELLASSSGAVGGAAGVQRQVGRPWRITAGAVVLATGGTTWKSRSLGGDVNTGDGHLMAMEVGARLSSMEMSSFYGIALMGTSMDKNRDLVEASYWTEDGTPITYDNLVVSRLELLSASLRGQVFARLDQFSPARRTWARSTTPNFYMVTDRLGIDPFDERFPIDWVLEGTVRGTGGVQMRDFDGASGVDGLFLAGDVAARDRIVGAATGAGGPNLAWAVATGTWSGRAAAARASTRDGRGGWLQATGGAGVRPRAGQGEDLDPRAMIRAVQEEILPIDKTAFRSQETLGRSLAVLDRLWERAVNGPVRASRSPAAARDALVAREAAALVAMARWANRTALERRESRGMHHRVDHPVTDPGQRRRLLAHGIDDIEVTIDAEPPVVGTSRFVS